MERDVKKSHYYFNPLYTLLILLCVIFLSIGYSAFSASLDISSITAIVQAEQNIKFTNMTIANTTNNGSSSYEEHNNSSVSSIISLPRNNSTVTYNLEITNLGNVEIGIENIRGLPNNLTYSLTNYTMKDMLCDDNNPNQCKLGAKTTIQITIGYANNGYNSNTTSYPIELNFTYGRVFRITYNGFADTTNLAKFIMDGDSKTITFNNITGIPFDVTVTGAIASYNNPTLTITNPTANITINRYCSITYNMNGGTNNNNNPTSFLANSSVSLEEPTYTDYIFDGWYENSNYTGSKVTSISNRNTNIVLYAKWNNTITYVLNGGTQASNQILTYNSISPQTILSPTHIHDANFDGWYQSSGLSGTQITSTSQLSGNATLYAKWQSGINNTTFDTNTNIHTATDISSLRLSRFATSGSYQYTKSSANTTINSVKLVITYSTANGAKLATVTCQVTSNSPGFTTVQSSIELPIRSTSAEATITLNNSIQSGYNYTINCNSYTGDGNGKYSIDGFSFLINP